MLVSRRTFFFGSLALPVLAAKKPEPLRPGILLIVADQLPSFMLGSYGNKQVRTPNLDRLAQMGIRFNNSFSCAPSTVAGRNTLLTGRTPMQLGEAGNIAPDDVTLSKMLSTAGYTCQEGDSAAAGKFLEGQTAGKPFFFTLNCAGVRPPYDNIPQKYLSQFAIEPFQGYAPDQPAPNAQSGKEYLPNILANVRKAAAALAQMDDEIGAVLATLKSRGLTNSTLVIFTAACGGLLGRHGLWDAAAASDPLNMYDEAVGTPLFWSWPGHVPAVAHRPELVSAYDLVPTLCDFLTLELPKRNLCGRSYLAIATAKPLPKKWKWRMTLFAHQGNTDMSREDRYKLVARNDGKGPNELYDLAVDPTERVNQAENPQFTTIHTELTTELEKWKKQYSS